MGFLAAEKGTRRRDAERRKSMAPTEKSGESFGSA